MSQEGGGVEQVAGVEGEGGDVLPEEVPPPPPLPLPLPLLTATPPAPVKQTHNAAKPTQPRKEESPFSFKHFLKRDLSLPTTSTSYESTGAKPKIYSNTVHPSPARNNQEVRKDGKANARESWAGPSTASSDSSIELILNTGSSSDSKNNYLEVDHCDVSSFRRSHTSNDALGMPSLPDFVQDHLLVEQAYLGSNGPFTVDFDNLPDFALSSNTNYENAQSSHCKTRDYCGSNMCDDKNSRIGICKSVPLDLPSFVEDRAESNNRAEGRCRPSPLDLPNNLTLDLTDSLNHSDRRDSHQRLPFPLDLPGNENSTGNEPLRLPDFLPTQAGAGCVGPANGSLARDELAEERRLRISAERELRAALQNAAGLRRELQAAKHAEQLARRELLETRTASARLARELRGAGRAGGASAAAASATAPHSPLLSEDEERFSAKWNANDDSNVAKLKSQINILKDELGIAQREIDDMRNNKRAVSRSLHLATNTAENSLRELLSGLEQLRGLASSLDPP